MTDRKTERDKSLPYYRWYVQDYRGSRNVRKLTYIERGLYRDLIDECWDKGSIPNDPVALAEICDCPLTVMAASWMALAPLFAEGPDSTVHSPRLEKERTAEDRARVLKAIAGRKGGLARSSSARMLASGAGVLQASRAEQLEQSKSSYAPRRASPDGAAPCLACAGAGDVHDSECPNRPADASQIAAITASLRGFGGGR